MKINSPRLLQTGIVFIGIAAFAFLLGEPLLEGRNAHSTLFQVYFNDLFLACVYVAAIPFFVGLYQAFKVLGYAAQNKIFSNEAMRSLRIIKYCALAIIGSAVLGELYIMLHESDDRAGGVFMGLLIITASIATATVSTMFERMIQKARSL